MKEMMKDNTIIRDIKPFVPAHVKSLLDACTGEIKGRTLYLYTNNRARAAKLGFRGTKEAIVSAANVQSVEIVVR